ncbi:ExbD/TolR family protein [Teredinibacter turnerae]|uniref:Membrane protein n=1 Tax=Teredinibacter turnerae (strain ATCC 39867 / T7901) TaxID=377629 RepID=C5BSC4_TERTT|nr:biopolymer transporter ExbD [Teredinibacter turnerae]ACR14603.1 putative membrane protein [Teredinibacter turnerae T7901]
MRIKRSRNQEADLDITSFMNLMIILVPVLLMSMVFSHVTVLDLTLPDVASSSAPASENPINDGIELVIEPDELVVNYPAGAPLKRIPKIADAENGEQVHDFETLSLTLQELKRVLKSNGKEKRDILILSQPDTDYQTIVKAMDTVRSFKTVVAASLVNAELFPAISLGDAPVEEASDLPGAQQ